MRRVRFPAAFGLAVLVAVGLAVMSARVKQFGDDLRRADVRFEVARTSQGDLWDSPSLRSGVLRGLLGANDDLDFREAVHLFRRSQLNFTSLHGSPDQLRAESTIALERFDKSDRDRIRRSRTANLLAIMSYQDASYDTRNADSLLRRSADELRRAIRLDPGNEAAKFNLELLLQLQKVERGSFANRFAGATGSSGGLTSGKPKSSGRGY